MDNACFVNGGQGVHNRREQRDCFTPRQSSASVQMRTKVRSFEKLLDHEIHVFLFVVSDIMHFYEIRMSHHGWSASFQHESLERRLLRIRHDLERYLAASKLVCGGKHKAHAAAPQDASDFVSTADHRAYARVSKKSHGSGHVLPIIPRGICARNYRAKPSGVWEMLPRRAACITHSHLLRARLRSIRNPRPVRQFLRLDLRKRVIQNSARDQLT